MSSHVNINSFPIDREYVTTKAAAKVNSKSRISFGDGSIQKTAAVTYQFRELWALHCKIIQSHITNLFITHDIKKYGITNASCCQNHVLKVS